MSDTTVAIPKAQYRPLRRNPVESPEFAAYDYVVPMHRHLEYANVLIRASTPREARESAEYTFAKDGWEIVPEQDGYKTAYTY